MALSYLEEVQLFLHLAQWSFPKEESTRDTGGSFSKRFSMGSSSRFLSGRGWLEGRGKM